MSIGSRARSASATSITPKRWTPPRLTSGGSGAPRVNPVSSQPYEVEGLSCENLEVSRMGNGRALEIILIGAHYNSVRGSPGANDNASGVAALLELSRLFAGQKPDRTVRFVAFVNEESPFFYRRQIGSMVYAEAARERGDDIRLMMSLEMLGSPITTPPRTPPRRP